jgi:hypothetical protein
MKTFFKGIATVLFYCISGALLIYAASRSLDFITATLPPSQQVIGFLGLAATSGGMISWLLVFLYKSEGMGQKITAALLTAIDLIGEVTLFSMDTLYRTGESGTIAQLTADEIRTVVLGLSALIAVNILATIVYHLVDPDNSRRMREGFVRDQLEAKALEAIEKRGDDITRRLAPTLANQWAEEFEARFSDVKALGIGQTESPTPATGPVMPMAWPRKKPTPAPAPEVEAVPVPLPGIIAGLPFGKNGNGHHDPTA